ncbi:MAG TPA: sialidase family protein [Herpetosiphonaceae bacterium]
MTWIKPARAAFALALLLAACLAGRPAAAQSPFRPTRTSTARGLPRQMIAADWGNHLLAFSGNGGRTWQTLPTASLPSSSASVALAPRNHPQPVRWLFTTMQTQPRIYRSGDFGQSWGVEARPELLQHPLGDTSYFVDMHPFAIPYADPSRVYVGQSERRRDCDSGPNCVYLEVGAVNVSTDSGVTWTTTGHRFGILSQLVVSPLVPGRLYAYQMADHSEPGAWLRSDDSGQTWAATTIPGPWLALDGADANVLYAGLERSTDGGQTWTPYARYSPCAIQPKAHPSIGGLLFQQCPPEFNQSYRSRDGGDSWQLIARYPEIDVSHASRLYTFEPVGGRMTLFESFDEGDTWGSAPILFEPLQTYLPALGR